MIHFTKKNTITPDTQAECGTPYWDEITEWLGLVTCSACLAAAQQSKKADINAAAWNKKVTELLARIQELETAGRKLTNKLMHRHPSTWGEVAILFGIYKTDAIVNDVREFAAVLNNTPLEKE